MSLSTKILLECQQISSSNKDCRVEDVIGWDYGDDSNATKRGAKPSLVESCILAWVAGLIWSEIKQLWDVGLKVTISKL